MTRIAVFASGSGSNAENIIRHFSDHPRIRVTCVCTNRPDAYVIERSKRLEVPVYVFNKQMFAETGEVLDHLREHRIDWIVLAGFLWLVPASLIEAYPDRIINIHPALLPAYGGKGMYGDHVHRAVIANGEQESGITIHLVNREYDRGATIFQARCAVKADDTPELLAARIHELEYRYFPEVIEKEVTRDQGRGTRM
jgi:phosphoribosylglycinamide formyltransferase 1